MVSGSSSVSPESGGTGVGGRGRADTPGLAGEGGSGVVPRAGAPAAGAGGEATADDGAVKGGSWTLDSLTLACPLEEGPLGAGPPAYHVAQLIAPGDAHVRILAINKHGDMVVSVESDTAAHAFVVTQSGVVPIDVPASFGQTVAVDIADTGAVLLRTRVDSNEPGLLVWQDGVVSPVSGVRTGTAIAINARGQVLYGDAYGNGFLWESGTSTPVQTAVGGGLSPIDLNDSGQVLAAQGEVGEVFLWQNGLATRLPFFDAVALSEQGQVWGYFRDGASGPGVLNDINVGVYRNGTVVPFASGRTWPTVNRDRETHVYGVDAAGDVVGETPPLAGTQPVPFVRYAVGMTELLPAATPGSAHGVSEAGIIVGELHSVMPDGSFGEAHATIWTRECFGSCCR